MTRANERQVGGEHYKKAKMEHWDLVEKYQVPYLEGVGSKYPLRWREKGGIEDLEKTIHYVEKILESSDSHPRWYRARQVSVEMVQDTRDLCDAHDIDAAARSMVLALLQGCSRPCLLGALASFRVYVSIQRSAASVDEAFNATASARASAEETEQVDTATGERHIHLHLPEGCAGKLSMVGGFATVKWERFK